MPPGPSASALGVGPGRDLRIAGVLLVSALGACAPPLPPSPAVVAAARGARFYVAEAKVSLKGPSVRAKARTLVAFRRPDAFRLEVPGPGGLRLLAVSHDGDLGVLFPGERAFFRGTARAETFHALFGVALAPREVMDALVGQGSPRLRAYRAVWGAVFPREVRIRLPDGGRLDLDLKDPESRPLPDEAFVMPDTDGYREIDAAEARSLWTGR